MMQSHVVECPLCFKNFSSMNIEKHVQACNGSVNASTEKQNSKRKRQMSDEQPQSSKRLSPWSKFQVKKEDNVDVNDNNKNFLSLDVKSTKTDDAEIVPSEEKINFDKPLAEMARPSCLDDYVGQAEVVGDGTSLNKLLKSNSAPSMILWGPPGCGKTTLAHIIASNAKKQKSGIRFVKMSATNSGKADVQATIKIATNEKRMFHRKTILFIDEIHRFNKLQQDTFLPHVENGTISLIGATTENPSFSLNSALLSRCRVVVLNKLESIDVKSLLTKALNKCFPDCKIIPDETTKDCSNTNGASSDNATSLTHEAMIIHESALETLSNLCDGDARTALNGLQLALQTVQSGSERRKVVTAELVKSSLQRTHVLYDRTGDQHYEIISALHKSIRGGDDNAALYWLARMTVGGEDPRYIARRLIRIAGEDVGLADPNAINQAISCYHACLYVGMPECDVALAQCVVYLARARKSVEVYKAFEKAKSCIKDHQGPIPGVPLHLRNASTKLMKNLGYGKGYKYKPDTDDEEQTYLPDELQHLDFFH